MKYPWLLIAIISLAPLTAQAQSADMTEEALRSRLVQHIALNPRLVKAVRRQNALEMAGEEVDERARLWRQAADTDPIKWEIQENEAGQLLQKLISTGQSLTGGYLTDRRGILVAAFPPPREYLHDKDPTWQTVYEQGLDGAVEIDSMGAGTDQVAVPVIDRGQVIGVLVATLGGANP